MLFVDNHYFLQKRQPRLFDVSLKKNNKSIGFLEKPISRRTIVHEPG